MRGADAHHHGHSRFALLCHGYIGTMHQTPSETIHYNMKPDPRVTAMSTQSQLTNIVHANAEAGVDVFVHSWNPIISDFIDKQYGESLRASLHEPIDRTLPKAQSQALSIGRAALLMRAHERRRRHAYTMALVIRNDLVIGAPVTFETFSPGNVWFALICCWYAPETAAQRAAAERRCGAPSSSRKADWLLSPCQISHQWGMGRRQTAEVDLSYYVMDWWFAAEPAVVTSWLDIATQWDTYMSALSRRSLRGAALFSHYLWPIHVHDMLNLTAQIRFADMQTGLARNALSLLRKRQPLRDCPYADLNGEQLPPERSQQALLDLPESEAHYNGAGLYFGRFTRRTAPMARMCPFTQQFEPIVCCDQRCGQKRCDAATQAGLNGTLHIVERAAERSGRTLDRAWLRDGNLSYLRVRTNRTHLVSRQCERAREGTVLGRLRLHSSCQE